MSDLTDERIEGWLAEYGDYDGDVKLGRIHGTMLVSEFVNLLTELQHHRSKSSRLTQLEADNARLRKAAQKAAAHLREIFIRQKTTFDPADPILQETWMPAYISEALSSTPAPGVVVVPVELLEQFLDEIGSEHGDDHSDANCRACNLHDQLRALLPSTDLQKDTKA